MAGNPNSSSLYFAAMLKAHGVRQIVACPGTCNAVLNHALQRDPYFECHSFFDERSAAYAACGIAAAASTPVCITCTGATAFRNFVPALTEAYYRKLPIIVGAFLKNQSHWEMEPQYLDHSVNANDIKRFSIRLPNITNEFQKKRFISDFNAAMSSLKQYGGPALLFGDVWLPFRFSSSALPKDVWVTELVRDPGDMAEKELTSRKAAIFIGCHAPFSKRETEILSEFAQKFHLPVYVGHTSNYHGANRVLAPRAVDMRDFTEFPDLIIDMGGMTENYAYLRLFSRADIWRLSPDGEYCCRADRPLKKLITCDELNFFETLARNEKSDRTTNPLPIEEACAKLALPELPLSAGLVCQMLAQRIPEGSLLHLGILNSLRAMNYFPLPPSVEVLGNVGGFGIDGSVSSLLGHSLACPDRLCFGLIGDLAFFYDMNALGNRQLGKNFRLAVLNNGNGEEMALNTPLAGQLGEEVRPLITAKGHNKGGCEGWAKSCGMNYFAVASREELSPALEKFCSPTTDGPILLEIFTKSEDEKKAYDLFYRFNRRQPAQPAPLTFKQKIKNRLQGKPGYTFLRSLYRYLKN